MFLAGQYVCKPNTSGSIEVRIFEVPPYTKKIPYGRVNHAKFMVTDRAAVICELKILCFLFSRCKKIFLGTSNWSADYFINTGGISLVLERGDLKSPLLDDLRAVHERDWSHATPIEEFTYDGERKNAQ